MIYSPYSGASEEDGLAAKEMVSALTLAALAISSAARSSPRRLEFKTRSY